ncbi:hypothetical protein [Kitasatospora kifunensis]|uniref:Flagellar motility protein MotE (MotC chaperone) n=1 Tax=Kitasatospora kifunensis TaxID=58351 RepID=A0A7W7QYH4_KITKI|nr:hypothetical protein [Kitasatospora kifunensis]MBB4922147.1 flagellar motility protein MotE (MotC chaperone) [Kitasatospora kifunensis]
MLNRKNRQIRTLQTRLDRVIEQRDEAIVGRDEAIQLSSRLAQKATAAAEHANRAAHAWGYVVKDANRAEALFGRAMAARRAESRRLHRIIDEQRRQLRYKEVELNSERERSRKLDQQLAILEAANRESDWRFGINAPTDQPLKAAS